MAIYLPGCDCGACCDDATCCVHPPHCMRNHRPADPDLAEPCTACGAGVGEECSDTCAGPAVSWMAGQDGGGA